MFFGVNATHYDDMSPHVSGITMVRAFDHTSWPPVPPGVAAMLSPRPDPHLLVTGALDAEMTTLLQAAPPNSYLTTWHEAEKGPNSPQGGLTAWWARRVHTYMLALTRAVNPAVKYGVILTQGGSANYTIPGLGFYGIDLYDLHETTDPTQALASEFAKLPRGRKVVAETNSSNIARRPDWFVKVYNWLAAHNGYAMLTFWNTTGHLSGPWVDDPATIDSLNWVSTKAAGG